MTFVIIILVFVYLLSVFLSYKIGYKRTLKKLELSLYESPRKGLYVESLEYSGDNPEKFKASYEIEEVCTTNDNKKTKVKVIDVLTDKGNINNDPNKINGIIKFLEGKWINTEEIKWFVDKKSRQEKIKKFISEI